MARSLNKAILIGNVGSDPEIRAVGSGSRVAQFSLATSRSWKDRNGQPQEKTEWHRIVVWENAGTSGLFGVIEKYVKKGERIYVEGEIEYRTFEDKDGNTRYVTEIRGREIMLLGSKGEGGGGGGDYERSSGGSRGTANAGAKKAGGSEYDDFQAGGLDEDDDLPF
jgi:single-strand DNA-binding protein